jgi:hypothetical protein
MAVAYLVEFVALYLYVAPVVLASVLAVGVVVAVRDRRAP